ncbi:histidine phosphatase superfamily [Halteromyces radiatus]|uniref:histidine phosphatase superfamily n=1 Tax=Halteromyces radiatus TaxID=101107 RepID=UPI00221F853F|nr:histidine phosphatase superfamily [Halteromyces radiatus]KAI8079801.1 histidine phosphatase superfamily [Halteromyces radiatus]
MLKEIWITRHGFREDWVNPTTVYPTGLTHDSPLSAEGLQQAEELGLFLKDKSIDRIYSSPFYRVVQTIAPLAKTTGVPVYLDHCMAEWYGEASPQYLPPTNLDHLQSFFPEVAIQSSYNSSIELPEGPETVIQCHQRTQQGLTRLIQQLDQQQDVSTILLAGHAATVITAVRALVGDPNVWVKSGTCSLAKLVRTSPQSWEWVLNGDCTHLSNGEQRAWMFKGDTPDYKIN